MYRSLISRGFGDFGVSPELYLLSVSLSFLICKKGILIRSHSNALSITRVKVDIIQDFLFCSWFLSWLTNSWRTDLQWGKGKRIAPGVWCPGLQGASLQSSSMVTIAKSD
jgi:hypothetical protein